MYNIRLSHLIVLCAVIVLVLTACASTSTTAQVSEATIQTPTAEPSETPIPPTSEPPTPTSPSTSSPDTFTNALPYDLPDMGQVEVRGVEYRRVEGQPYFMDVYYPPQIAADERLPVVIFVMGFPDDAAQQLLGAPIKDLDPYRSWGRLVAAAGMIGVTYETGRADDLDQVVKTIRQDGDTLQMDADRIGLWSSSANSPTAVSFAMRDEHNFLRFAVFYYGIMPTPDGFQLEELRATCREFGCYAPNPDDDLSGLPEVAQIRLDLPLLIARAGNDPQVNIYIDHFVEEATAVGAQLTLLDHLDGNHSFDHLQTDERTIEIIDQTMAFMSANFAQP